MRCLICHQRIEDTLYWLVYPDEKLCLKCRTKWRKTKRKQWIQGLSIYSSYRYEDGFKDALWQYKELGDEALYPIFLSREKAFLRRLCFGRTLVGMPSTEEKINKRGFHHLEKMFSVLDRPLIFPFEKNQEKEQKHQTLQERQKIKLIRHKEIHIPRKIVLVDDLITTGSTLKAAIKQLSSEIDYKIYVVGVTSYVKNKGEK